jgi:hypothetical protein
LTVSLEPAHHNYLFEVAYTSVLHPTEPDTLVQKNYGRILSENGIQGAFNWLDCVYTIDMNAYDQY